MPMEFFWQGMQAEPTGNDTATPSGTLNQLYGSGTAAPAETGLKSSHEGVITPSPIGARKDGSGGRADACAASCSLQLESFNNPFP
jgi:hypothetical protein